MTPTLNVDRAHLESFCKKHHIQRLSLFGSAVRDDFGPGSDVDVLVEFEQGKAPGLAFFSLQDELTEIIGRPVDLHTPASLSRYIRDDVLREAQVQYVEA